MTSSNGNSFTRYWPFVREIHRSPVNSPHKGQWRGSLMFSFICAGINGWVNNRKAADLRRHRAYYGVTVMIQTLNVLIFGLVATGTAPFPPGSQRGSYGTLICQTSYGSFPVMVAFKLVTIYGLSRGHTRTRKNRKQGKIGKGHPALWGPAHTVPTGMPVWFLTVFNHDWAP